MRKILSSMIVGVLLVTGCGIRSSGQAQSTSSNFSNILENIPTLQSPFFLPSLTVGWLWEEQPAATTTLRELSIRYNKSPSVEIVSDTRTSPPPQHGLLLFYPTAAALQSDATNSIFSLFLHSQSSALPVYSNYANISQFMITAEATTTGKTGCSESFTNEYPFALSSVWFKEAPPFFIDGVRFEHATETLRSKTTPVTQDFYRGAAYGICYRIMKIVDRGGISSYKGEKIEQEFTDVLQSISFF